MGAVHPLFKTESGGVCVCVDEVCVCVRVRRDVERMSMGKEEEGGGDDTCCPQVEQHAVPSGGGESLVLLHCVEHSVQ